ncbi:hypothetical protein L6164_036183 [Bauhinia variegata]|uniref:Uncharacterized protein n=1 Tax=Bauhinia variegata TaxID=167791 RepID=A0ACB9KGA7_BAUVA|nr:hypothetical protein L6164_036183 [Bauhinia variegata]
MNVPVAFKTEEVYKECRHNHAASLGYISFDGCGEFLKPDDNTTMDSMLCAACGCHQNFHRKSVVYIPVMQPTPFSSFHSEAFVPGSSGSGFSFMNVEVEMMTPRRRRRTVFTPEQKNRMLTFAEKSGWSAKNADGEELEHFCQQMGISRRTFMVWLSNNRRLQLTEKDDDKDTVATNV